MLNHGMTRHPFGLRVETIRALLNVGKGTKNSPVGQESELSRRCGGVGSVLGTLFLHFNGFSGVFH